MKKKLGFMQGRLVRDENRKIQSFPEKNWKKEFSLAKKLNLKVMEWTIDRKNIFNNPLFVKDKLKEIKSLCKKNLIKINSATCDFFMQKPFFKFRNTNTRNKELYLIDQLLDHSKLLGIKYLIFPIVDNASINSKKEEKQIIKNLIFFKKKLCSNGQMILFESDFPPKKLLSFIKKFPKKCFGINYDVGNSAAYGFKIEDEKIYFDYVKNIHLKDRKLNGNTIRLGLGNADFKSFFNFLRNIKYDGNLILQTARDKNDIKEVERNIKFVKKYI